MLPFTTEEFFAVFARYNTAIWPAQILAASLGLAAVLLLLRSGPTVSQVISAILATFWLFTGVGYHWLFFAPINPMAHGFALLFLAQSVLLLVHGVARQAITYQSTAGWQGGVGWMLIVYGLVLYPLIGLAGAHPYPQTPLFGVAPCPTIIFALGVLLMSNAAWPLFVIPLMWSAIGGSAAVLLAVPQDYGLILAGFLAALTLCKRGAHAM